MVIDHRIQLKYRLLMTNFRKNKWEQREPIAIPEKQYSY